MRNNKGNVFVGNLPPNFSDERLAEAFDPFGHLWHISTHVEDVSIDEIGRRAAALGRGQHS